MSEQTKPVGLNEFDDDAEYISKELETSRKKEIGQEIAACEEDRPEHIAIANAIRGGLAQQLAAARKQIVELEEDNRRLKAQATSWTASAVRMLEQQLAECEKQVVKLRDAAERLIAERTAGLASLTAWEKMKEALDATDDLSNCILCDAEPAAYMSREMLYPPITVEQRRTTDIPLYKARTK